MTLHRNIRIGFDMDGVIIDHTANKIALAAELGVEITPEQTPSEIIHPIFPRDKYREFQFKLYDDPATALRAPLTEGISEFLASLTAQRIPVALITRRKNIEIARALLKKHELWPKYFREDNVALVPDKPGKNIQAVAYGITHYIDDEIGVLEHLIDVPNKILFDIHNVQPDSPAYIRVSSWKQLEKILL